MPVKSVAVEVEFRVQANEIALLGDDERVDLEKAHILLGERPVEVADQVHALPDLAILQAQREGDLPAMKWRDSRLLGRCGA